VLVFSNPDHPKNIKKKDPLRENKKVIQGSKKLIEEQRINMAREVSLLSKINI